MSPRADRLRRLARWTPLTAAATACAAAAVGWQFRSGGPDSIGFWEATFRRQAADLRLTVARFEFDSCPGMDGAGQLVWAGNRTEAFDASLWPVVGLTAAPLAIVMTRRRLSRPAPGFPVALAHGRGR